MTDRAKQWRKKAVRAAFLIHRWLGIGLGALMLLWCLSGMVMLWKPWPQPDEQLAILAHEPLRFDRPPVLPDLHGSYRQFRLVMAGSVPVLQVMGDKAESRNFDLRTGQILGREDIYPDPAALAEVAGRYAALEGETAPPVFRGLRRVDQWILNTKGHDAGFYRFDFDSPRHTILYLSPLTGDVVQATTRKTRFWSWLGAIPHWLYFSQLRRYPVIWSDTLILLSGLGVTLTTLGLWIGLRRFRVGRRLSPYRGTHLIHHAAGSVFGLFLLSWILTGFLSMNPAGLMAHKPSPLWMSQWRGTLPASALTETIAALTRVPHQSFRDVLVLPGARGTRLALTDAEGNPQRLDLTLAPSPLTGQELVDTMAQTGTRAEVTLLENDDAYYFSTRHKRRVFPVFRLIGQDRARLYLDTRTGEALLRIDTSEKGSRWVIYGPHDLDFFSWLRQPDARLWIILPLLGGVSLICLSGLWIGVKRCRHRRHSPARLDHATRNRSGRKLRRHARS